MSDHTLGRDGPSLILAGYDGTDSASRAVALAAGNARRQRARLLIAYGSTNPLFAEWLQDGVATVDRSAEQSEHEFRTQLREALDNVGIAHEFARLYGNPASVLLELADRYRADMIVVGRPERRVHRSTVGVPGRLIRDGRWPVLVVP